MTAASYPSAYDPSKFVGNTTGMSLPNMMNGQVKTDMNGGRRKKRQSRKKGGRKSRKSRKSRR